MSYFGWKNAATCWAASEVKNLVKKNGKTLLQIYQEKLAQAKEQIEKELREEFVSCSARWEDVKDTGIRNLLGEIIEHDVDWEEILMQGKGTNPQDK